MAVTVRELSTVVDFDGTVLDDVIGARGEVSADSGWPTCSIFVTAYPRTAGGDPIDEENPITVTAGAGNNVVRFTGRVRRFRPSSFPKSIEIVATGTLAYAAEWAPSEDIIFDDPANFPDGATDEEIVAWVLDKVPGVTYSAANLDGTGVVLGSVTQPTAAPGSPDAFNWKAGTSAWSYLQNLDRATLYRTYQTRDGTIRRVKMIGHPDTSEDFTLEPVDILDGASGSRNTEQTRNFVRVRGYDYGNGLGPVGAELAASNSFQGDGSDPATRHVSEFASDLIESGVDPDTGDWDERSGLRADEIAAEVIDDVNKEFVEAQIPSWRDDTHGPGLTCLLDAYDRLHIGEKMWVVRHAWETGDNGWTVTYSMTGGGLPKTNPPPPV